MFHPESTVMMVNTHDPGSCHNDCSLKPNYVVFSYVFSEQNSIKLEADFIASRHNLCTFVLTKRLSYVHQPDFFFHNNGSKGLEVGNFKFKLKMFGTREIIESEGA